MASDCDLAADNYLTTFTLFLLFNTKADVTTLQSSLKCKMMCHFYNEVFNINCIDISINVNVTWALLGYVVCAVRLDLTSVVMSYLQR